MRWVYEHTKEWCLCYGYGKAGYHKGRSREENPYPRPSLGILESLPERTFAALGATAGKVAERSAREGVIAAEAKLYTSWWKAWDKGWSDARYAARAAICEAEEKEAHFWEPTEWELEYVYAGVPPCQLRLLDEETI